MCVCLRRAGSEVLPSGLWQMPSVRLGAHRGSGPWREARGQGCRSDAEPTGEGVWKDGPLSSAHQRLATGRGGRRGPQEGARASGPSSVRRPREGTGDEDRKGPASGSSGRPHKTHRPGA